MQAIAPGQQVLLATGSSEITKREALEAGFCGMLKKPFPFRALLECVERLGLLRGDAAGSEGGLVEAGESLGMISDVWAVA